MTYPKGDNGRSFVPAKDGESRTGADCDCSDGWKVPERVWDWISGRHAWAHNKGRDGLTAGARMTIQRIEPGAPSTGRAAEADSAMMRAELLADLTSARHARAAVRQTLAAWGLSRLSSDGELMASELVANAAEHGDGYPISLALYRHAEPGGPPTVTCEVTDTSPAMPQRTDPGPDAERGRGLAIVEALAQTSGVRATQAGKTTWFTLALTDRAHQVARQLEHEPEAGA
jgi:anti-sigma regulatory factor (Ser/Thr protein kinase)